MSAAEKQRGPVPVRKARDWSAPVGPPRTDQYEVFRIDSTNAFVLPSLSTTEGFKSSLTPMESNERSASPAPTDAELRILRVLWKRGPATVRDVHDVLAAERPAGYTTTLKFLQIMLEKGLVTRDESARTHVYAAAVAEGQTQRTATADLMDRLFGGSAAALMQHALAVNPSSREELRRIREMLDALDRDRGEDARDD